MVTGTLIQNNVPDDWAMILPVTISFGNNQFAYGSVLALGKSRPFQFKLPMRPKKIELDPDHWVLSAGTSTKGA
jgi:hypothetical protein